MGRNTPTRRPEERGVRLDDPLTEDVIERILRRLPGLAVGVLGDLFLDRYLDVDAALTEPSLETGLDAYQVTRVRSYPAPPARSSTTWRPSAWDGFTPSPLSAMTAKGTSCGRRWPPSAWWTRTGCISGKAGGRRLTPSRCFVGPASRPAS